MLARYADGMSNWSAKITDANKLAFLEALSRCGVISAACRTSNVGRTTQLHWREVDGDFAEAFEFAMYDAADALEVEARRRALEGDVEPVVYQGQQVYLTEPDGTLKLDENFEHVPLTMVRRSDRLLELMLKAKKVGFRDKSSVELTGAEGGVVKTLIEVVLVDPDPDPDDEEPGGEEG